MPTWIKLIREWRKRRFWRAYRERMEELLGPHWKAIMRQQLHKMGAEQRIAENEKLWAEMESFIGKKEDDVDDRASKMVDVLLDDDVDDDDRTSKIVDLLLGPGGRDGEWGAALKGLPPHLRGLPPKPQPLLDEDEMEEK